ncbi:MAG TPA: ribonuclease HII [Thermoanaerobaculia bacterium]
MRPDPLPALFAELGRLAELDRLERELRRRGYRSIAGVDEAGRGSLAGPVVAAAVILPERCLLPGLDDSKRLDRETREHLDVRVRKVALAVGVGVVDARDIDARDILRASLQAMRIAVEALSMAPDAVLLDAVTIPRLPRPQLPVVHGDALCASIAAASVIAKVHRDRLLTELATRFPAYGFEQHKGYGTPEHWEALRLCGPCPEHRLTYQGVVAVPDVVAAPASPEPRHPTRRGRGAANGAPSLWRQAGRGPEPG